MLLSPQLLNTVSGTQGVSDFKMTDQEISFSNGWGADLSEIQRKVEILRFGFEFHLYSKLLYTVVI